MSKISLPDVIYSFLEEKGFSKCINWSGSGTNPCDRSEMIWLIVGGYNICLSIEEGKVKVGDHTWEKILVFDPASPSFLDELEELIRKWEMQPSIMPVSALPTLDESGSDSEFADLLDSLVEKERRRWRSP